MEGKWSSEGVAQLTQIFQEEEGLGKEGKGNEGGGNTLYGKGIICREEGKGNQKKWKRRAREGVVGDNLMETDTMKSNNGYGDKEIKGGKRQGCFNEEAGRKAKSSKLENYGELMDGDEVKSCDKTNLDGTHNECIDMECTGYGKT